MKQALLVMKRAALVGAHIALLAAPIGAGLVWATPAAAAEGDYCYISADRMPGLENAAGQCIADPGFEQGGFCGEGLFFDQTAGQCFANNESCTISGGGSGVYSNGTCQALPSAPTMPDPTVSSGFTLDPNAASAPTGEQQPMCVNASPFIGGGMFVVSGTVLCYEGAGRPMGIYAYTDGGGGGWNPFDRDAWDSLAVTGDVYAGDDITALGTMSAFGGAQFYSANGNNGVQVNNAGVLIRSGDGNNVASISTTPGQITSTATNGTASAGVNINGNGTVTTVATDGSATSGVSVSGSDGIGVVGNSATAGPGVTIAGAVGDASTARTGVYVTGDGQGVETAPVSGPANWADVLIGSKSFTPDNDLGSGIIVNDYGVTVRSSAVGNSYNQFGAAGNAGSMVLNEIGTGNGGGATTNVIGNTHADSRFAAMAGTSSMVVVQGALDFATGQGQSVLSGATQLVSGGSATSMLGGTGRHVVMDDSGRMTVINGVATQASSSLYIVNGHGNTNGVVVTESTAALSGGTSNPTTMALSDSGVNFSNSSTGGPVRVSGIADGSGPFDAANVRQVHSGIASVAALAALPAPQAGKTNSLGIAMGHHGTGMAVALGGQSLIGDMLTVKYGASLGYASGLIGSTASVGVGLSW
jgi:hypothetical protein